MDSIVSPRAPDADLPRVADIEAAVAIVAAADARQVVLVGLPDPRDLLPRAMAIGQRVGVRVRLDHAPTGDALVVERLIAVADTGAAPLATIPRRLSLST